MTHIILTGATGTAGSAVLARLIASPSISRISILARRPVKQAVGVAKARVFVHEDFTSYPPTLLSELKGATGCIWALGIATGQVDAVAYRKITLDYPLAAAKAFAALSPAFNFVYVSGEGANRTPGHFSPLFARTKGETEVGLLSLLDVHPSLRIYNVRPAFIDDTQGPKLREAPPKSLSYQIMDRVAPVMRTLWPSGVSPTGKLAEMLIQVAEEEKGGAEVRKALEGKGVTWDIEGDEKTGVLIENVGVRRLVGL